jgi:hypothetical protein
VRAEFGHVPEHGEAAAFARQILQGPQGREHGIGVGIVRVIQHTHSVDFPQLQSHAGGLALDEAFARICERLNPSSAPSAIAINAFTA